MSQPKPYFSIIIPTLNEEKYLPKLLTDLKNQSFQDFELIIVDAYSTDKTIDKAKTFTSLKPNIILSEKKNVSIQRNVGADHAQSNQILFVDADSRLPHYYLDGIKYRLLSQPTDCYTTFILPDSNNRQDLTVAKAANLGLIFSKAIDIPIVSGSLFGIKKPLFHKVKGFDPKLKFQQDVDIITKLAKIGAKFTIYKDPKVVYSFRRLRKQGLLGSAAKTAKFQLSYFSNFISMQDSEYPMIGGEFYNGIPNKTPLVNLKPLESKLKHLTSNQKKRLKHLIKQLNYTDQP